MYELIYQTLVNSSKMKIDFDRNVDGVNRIHAYSAGGIVIADTIYDSSLILSSNTIIGNWHPENIFQLTPDDLDQIIELNPELVLLGTGAKLLFPEHTITMAFYSRNIGFEVMDTGAACRTFNVLLAEERRVFAALIAVD